MIARAFLSVALALVLAVSAAAVVTRVLTHATRGVVCALNTTPNDVGWRDAQGHTHDYMPHC